MESFQLNRFTQNNFGHLKFFSIEMYTKTAKFVLVFKVGLLKNQSKKIGSYLFGCTVQRLPGSQPQEAIAIIRPTNPIAVINYILKGVAYKYIFKKL